MCLSALIYVSSRLPPTPISVSSDPSFHHLVQASTPTPTGQLTSCTLPCLAVLPRGRGSAGVGVRMLSQAELPLTPQIALGWVLNGAWFPLSPPYPAGWALSLRWARRASEVPWLTTQGQPIPCPGLSPPLASGGSNWDCMHMSSVSPVVSDSLRPRGL